MVGCMYQTLPVDVLSLPITVGKAGITRQQACMVETPLR